MPPRRFKKKSVKRLVEKHVAKAIEEYEKNRANLDSAGSSGGNPGNAGGIIFLLFYYEFACVAEEDKVMFAASTFEGRVLTWWNGNCPLKRRRLKGILVFLERIKGNITSSKSATLHDAINMARELVEQAVQGRATRISESNKRKWEDHQRNNNNNRNRNNNYHQQQNRRQETARAYAAAPTENRGYAGNLPKCNRCNFHHSGRCPPKCQKCQRNWTLEKDWNQHNEGARARAYVVVENPQQNPNVVTDLLPTRLGSFDVIVGMDWLSYHRAVIDCYEKIADEKKLDDIRVVRDFLEVFPYDLSGLPPVREIEFRIDLIPGASPVVKSPYRLAPSEMLELSNQLKELQEKGLHTTNEAFCILKEKLCNAPVLALPDGPDDFVVYCDASKQGFGCVLMQRGKVIAYASRQKERLSQASNVAMSITIHSGLKTKILEAQGEASKDLKALAEWLRGLEKHFERRDDGGIYFFDRIWIPSVGSVRKLIMDEAHTSRYLINPGADKMYHDLRDLYRWPSNERDIAST
ncbi:putative reverse transcriptase domain-containing protein [Tanacetum coccineum]